MNQRHHLRSDERKDDPPYSRIFVVCSKRMQEDDLKTSFKEFGTIEDIYIPRDRHTGDSKGVAYIRYKKTSEAAEAVQKMNQKCLMANDGKPLKVMIASDRTDKQDISEEKYKRLFIKVSKNIIEEELVSHFSTFGRLESVHIQKDKVTKQNKGFAYVNFQTFLDAAKAFEGCDPKYKAVFATPRDLKRNSSEPISDIPRLNSYSLERDVRSFDRYSLKPSNSVMQLPKPTNDQGFKTIQVTCTPQVSKKYIENVFDIVPGLVDIQFTMDTYNGFCKAIVTFEKEEQAAYAVNKLHLFEYPSGEILFVKPHKNQLSDAAMQLTNIVNSFKSNTASNSPDLMQLANIIAQASSLIKEATNVSGDVREESQEKHCSVDLPPAKQLADRNSTVEKRCFIVCKPHPLPSHVLNDIFCRFGDLIEVSLLPNKNYGFAKFATVRAADDAIKTLHKAIICDVSVKVLEAVDKPSKNSFDVETDNELMLGSKRIKLED